MATFLVTRQHAGPEWQPGKPLPEQTGWRDHAAFMNVLVDSGFVLLGGPVGDGIRVVLVVEAESPEAIRARLATDPWSEKILLLVAIEPWTILLDGR